MTLYEARGGSTEWVARAPPRVVEDAEFESVVKPRGACLLAPFEDKSGTIFTWRGPYRHFYGTNAPFAPLDRARDADIPACPGLLPLCRRMPGRRARSPRGALLCARPKHAGCTFAQRVNRFSVLPTENEKGELFFVWANSQKYGFAIRENLLLKCCMGISAKPLKMSHPLLVWPLNFGTLLVSWVRPSPPLLDTLSRTQRFGILRF